MTINVIGAGLAGCEAAWQIANSGIKVKLYEQKPNKFSPAHKTEYFAELVCSNSLRAEGIFNAVGLLKEEMRRLNSIIMQAADSTKVPAGGALAVDREGFSRYVTEKLKKHPLIEVIYQEVKQIPTDGITIIATGPLTEGELAEDIKRRTGGEYLYFFDAASPIVTYDSINHDKVYRAARYGKGGADYINCPMNKEEYLAFYHELIHAQTVEIKDFENKIFEGCMPIEVMAKRGEQTLLFGTLKPVGLEDPHGNLLYAVVQLRQDNAAGTLYNMVGFQTNLKFGEQKRVFSMIPGLEDAQFVRYGVMHRNTYIDSPEILNNIYQHRQDKNLFFAGQITGVEGYVESASSGLVAGLNAALLAKGKEPFVFDIHTATGALSAYISNKAVKEFQPMNINFGLIPPLERRIKNKKEKNELIAKRALDILEKQLAAE